MIWSAKSLDDYKTIASELITKYSSHRVFLLHGDMGAGKTTFTKRLISHLGVKESGSSPTFGIVNEHEYPEGKAYHFDCYRLQSEEEALGIGIIDYIDSGDYCFIEWPERIEGLLPENFILIKITVNNKEDRTIETKAF